MWSRSKLLAYTGLSLFVAIVGYFLLGSAGDLESQGLRITGGIVIYFANFWLLLRNDKLFDKHELASSDERQLLDIDTRDEYIERICHNIANANASVLVVYRSLRCSAASAEAKAINEALVERARGNGHPCKILVLAAKDPQNISGASGLIIADSNITVVFHPSLNTSDLRLSITDKTQIVVGFSGTQSSQKGYMESHNWFESNSATLTQVLDSYASSLASEGTAFEQFLNETVAEMKHLEKMDMSHIGSLLGIPMSVVAEASDAQNVRSADTRTSRR